MHIFIDESGTFTSAQREHAISAVAALTIPDAALASIEKTYATLRPHLPMENSEVKGRLLSESHVSDVVSLLTRHQVLFEITAIDMGTQETADVVAHKTAQAARLTKHLTPAHHPNIHEGVRKLQTRLEQMSPQLYVQTTATFQLIQRVIQHGTLFYAQRIPKELGAFHWIIDGKDRARITDWEDWWSYVIRPFLQSMSLREPLVLLRESDYSYFQRFSTKMLDHLKPHITENDGNDDATDINMLMTEGFRFSSKPEPGLELVDILVNATRRAMMGSLAIEGWRRIPHLMIHTRRHYIQMISLHNRAVVRRRWPYMSVLRHFSQGGKNMLVPRSSR